MRPMGCPGDGKRLAPAAPVPATPTQLATMTRPYLPRPLKSKQNPDVACNRIEFDIPGVEQKIIRIINISNRIKS